MRFFLIKLLMRLLTKYTVPLEKINEEERDTWLKSLYAEHGFRDYFKYRDLQILKTLGNPLKDEIYWMQLGARTELMYMLGQSTNLLKKEDKEKYENAKRNQKK